MTEALIQFAVAALFIVGAAIFLTRAGDVIAELSGLGRLLVGSLFLAGATSLPELLVDLSAVRQGTPDLAVGDLMGSSLFNLMILAIVDLVNPAPAALFSRRAVGHALPGVLSIAVTCLATIGILLGARGQALPVGEVGLVPIAILVAYLFGLRLIFAEQRYRATVPEEPASLEAREGRRAALVRAVLTYVGSAAVILVAAPYLAEAAAKLAELSGLGTTFLGTTLVAFSTSLPELVSTLAAVRMGSLDMAVGNIYGSNAFNMVMFGPLDFVHQGPLFAAVSRTHALTGLSTILLTTVALMGQLYQVEPRQRVLDPDAWLMLGLGVVALWLVYVSG